MNALYVVWGDDYDVWWKDDELYKGDKIEFKCQRCQSNLISFYDGDGIFSVIKKEE
jgi:hypothetical protein